MTIESYFVILVWAVAAVIVFWGGGLVLGWVFRRAIRYDLDQSCLSIHAFGRCARRIGLDQIATIREVSVWSALSPRMQFTRVRYGNRLGGPLVDVALRKGGGVLITPESPKKFIADYERLRRPER